MLQNSTKHIKQFAGVYLPGLNGLRAIAALAVVFSHTTLALPNFALDANLFNTVREGAGGLFLAGYGVNIFFTLSGFLITYLLLKEKENGKINVKHFYFRRALRIWPLYYLYLIICILTLIYFHITFQYSNVIYYVFLAANVPFIFNAAVPCLAHYWSLAVEEQFYLLFPHLLKYSNKAAFRIALTLCFILLALKVLFWYLSKYLAISLPYNFINVLRFHMLLFGVLAAFLFYDKNKRFMAITSNVVVQFFVWICVFLIAINRFHVASVIDGELVSLLSVFLIMGQICEGPKLISLENKIFDFLGRISYGLYVIHPLLILILSKKIGHLEATVFNYVMVFALTLSSSILLAFFSYTFFEKRFLRMKSKFTVIKNSDSKPQSLD